MAALTYPAFGAIDASDIAQHKALLQAILQAYYPNYDLGRGTVHDLVLHARSLLAAASDQAISNGLQQHSLLAMIADPTLASTAAVDRILGNYGLTRRAGTIASGEITIVLTAATIITIPQGSIFTIGGQKFSVVANYTTRRTSAEVRDTNDKVLAPVSGNRYAFQIRLTAVSAGSAGNVAKGLSAVPSITIPTFAEAYVAGNFTGGRNADTNTTLLAQLTGGLACKPWSNRLTIEAATKQLVPATQYVSLVGFGDDEMRRDRRSIWPGSTGGRADMYVQTEFVRTSITKTALLISKSGSVGTWQISLTKTDVPGFYEVVNVYLATDVIEATPFAVASDSRGYDITNMPNPPDVTTGAEAAYSRYQTAVITFNDTITNATSLTVGVATGSYRVAVRQMTAIDTIQDYWSAENYRPPTGDLLVRAAIPCFMTITVQLQMEPDKTADLNIAKSVIITTVNSLGFVGQLSLTRISQALHNAIPGIVSIGSVTLAARLRKPNAATWTAAHASLITIPTDAANSVSANTTVFLTSSELVTVTQA